LVRGHFRIAEVRNFMTLRPSTWVTELSFLNLIAATSAYVRSSHHLQGCFDTSPSFRIFRLTLLLEAPSLLSGLNDRHLAMGLKQLSGIVVNLDLFHPHVPSSLSLEAT
jgi:hypothetical protein